MDNPKQQTSQMDKAKTNLHDHFQTHESVTISDVIGDTDISRSTAWRAIDQAREKGIIHGVTHFSRHESEFMLSIESEHNRGQIEAAF